MKLSAYIKRERLKIADFAEKISVHEKTVCRYLGGKRIPNSEVLKRIFVATEGEVTANDFFSTDDEEDERQQFAAA